MQKVIDYIGISATKMKKVDLFVADSLFILHIFCVAVILFGWMFPKIRIVYLILLLLTLASWTFLHYCPLTKWEFDLRKKYNKNIDYMHEYINFYVNKFLKVDIPVRNVRIYCISFLTLSIFFNIFLL